VKKKKKKKNMVRPEYELAMVVMLEGKVWAGVGN